MYCDRIRYASTVDWDKIIEKREDGCWTIAIDMNDTSLARKKHEIKRVIFEHYTGQNTNNLKGFRHCEYLHCVNPDHYEYVSHMDKCRKKRTEIEKDWDKARGA